MRIDDGYAEFAMLEGLATLLADQFEKLPANNKTNALESFQKLSEFRADVEIIMTKIQRDPVFPLSDQEIKDGLDTLDKVSAAVLKMGYA